MLTALQMQRSCFVVLVNVFENNAKFTHSTGKLTVEVVLASFVVVLNDLLFLYGNWIGTQSHKLIDFNRFLLSLNANTVKFPMPDSIRAGSIGILANDDVTTVLLAGTFQAGTQVYTVSNRGELH